jgi:integrase
MNKYPMVDFYGESRSDTVLDSTVGTTVEILERIFDALTANYGVTITARSIEGLNGEVLQRWVNGFKKTHAVTSVNLYICILNPFLRWAHTMTYGDGVPYLKAELGGVLKTMKLPDPDKIPEWERPKSKYYTEEEVSTLMDVKYSHNKVRDKAIIALFLGSGIRVSELCSLTLGSILDRQRGTIYLRRKGGVWKETEVADFAYAYIDEYLKTRDLSDHSAPLFLTREGLPCNRKQIYKSLSHIQKRMDVATGPHALRHTFVSAAEKAGGGAVARDLANHKSMTITNRYDHSNREQRIAAVNSLPWAISR